MSVKMMSMVWDTDLQPPMKLVLLAYADHADHDGNNIYPSIALIAHKTGYHSRTVQRITRDLERAGYLVEVGTGPKGQNKWRMPNRGGKLPPPPGSTPPLGVTPAPPEPSVNHPELIIIKLYQQIISPTISEMMSHELMECHDTYDEQWIVDAFNLAESNNARNWKYVKTVLSNWKAHGYGWSPRQKKGKQDGNIKASKETSREDESLAAAIAKH